MAKILLVNYSAPLASDTLEAELRSRGLTVARSGAVVEEIEREASDADAVVLFAGDFIYNTPEVLRRLKAFCLDGVAPLCLAGYREEIAAIETVIPKALVEREFARPIEPAQLAEKAAAVAVEHETRKGQKTLLLVDDDAVFLQMMQKWLSSKYRVNAVKSGAQALSFVKAHRPDLILLDFEMPDASGPQVLEALRQEPASASIPVVFLTGKCDERSAESAARLEPDGYLLKAAGKEHVLDFVEDFFVSRGAPSPTA